jgi:hypothetical protein
MNVTPIVPPSTISTPVGWKKYPMRIPALAIPASTAPIAMTMPATIQMSSFRGSGGVGSGDATGLSAMAGADTRTLRHAKVHSCLDRSC